MRIQYIEVRYVEVWLFNSKISGLCLNTSFGIGSVFEAARYAILLDIQKLAIGPHYKWGRISGFCCCPQNWVTCIKKPGVWHSGNYLGVYSSTTTIAGWRPSVWMKFCITAYCICKEWHSAVSNSNLLPLRSRGTSNWHSRCWLCLLVYIASGLLTISVIQNYLRSRMAAPKEYCEWNRMVETYR